MATVECKHILPILIVLRELIKLWLATTKVLKPWGRALIKLDLSMFILEDCRAFWLGKHMSGITVHDGTIDSD